MSVHLTEEQQVEQLKKLWDDYGNIIAALIFVVALGITGYHWWQKRQHNINIQASSLYETMLSAEQAEKFKDSELFASRLLKEHGSSTYADFARLILAKHAADKGKADEAATILERVSENAVSEQLRSLARVRLARVQLVQGQANKALATVELVKDPAFASLTAEVRGDAYTALKQYAEAKAAYETVLAKTGEHQFSHQFTNMKLQVLPAPTAANSGRRTA
jgi:predicted negative regulator of RcsB-dependent stress response